VPRRLKAKAGGRSRRRALIPVLAAAVGLPLLLAAPATAARPCGPIKVTEGAKARVATVGVSCSEGKEVASTYYQRLADGDHWDGKAHNAIYFQIDGFRCFTGLGGTQMMCRSQQRWVLASVRPEDHTGSWHVETAKRVTYWRHCQPPDSVSGVDMLAHRVSCGAAGRVIHRVLVKSQTAQSPVVRAQGFSCRLHPYASRAVSCRDGERRILSPLPG
jgi:hypothetical protein